MPVLIATQFAFLSGPNCKGTVTGCAKPVSAEGNGMSALLLLQDAVQIKTKAKKAMAEYGLVMVGMAL